MEILSAYSRGISAAVRSIKADDRRRLRDLAIALGVVGAAVIVRIAARAATPVSPLWLFQLAVAVSAAVCGFVPAAVAALASVLAARLTSGIDGHAAALFVIEAFLISLVIVRLSEALRRERGRSAAADACILELKAVERRARIVDRALEGFDAAAVDNVIVILDGDGRIQDWRIGATRLFGYDAHDVIDQNAAMLFAGEPPQESFARLLDDARRASADRQVEGLRADGSSFSAEIEIRPLSKGGADGFAMIVRDLTRQHAWDAFATSAAESQALLRQEADLAQLQLAALQHVTEPSLNLLSGVEVVTTLLDRLRAAIDAEGIALVYLGRFRRGVFCASDGLQCQAGFYRPHAELQGEQFGRTMIVHNDPARVAELSSVQWPEGVSSLITVPVVRAGSMYASIEVVNGRGRRSTEWEIALSQVVAARIAGLVRDDPYADAGAA